MMSKLVPEGWNVKKLIDCSLNGISNGVFRDPKTVGSGYKLINVLEMYQGFGVDVNLTERLPLSDKEFSKNKVNYGDVFFTRSSLKLEGIAYCNINLSHDNDITYEGHLMRVVPNTNIVEPQYLARFCLSDPARTFFMSSAKHSTMTTISQTDIAPLDVLLPPLPEQQKIAAILTAVDDVIESIQAQIDKLKDLKTGMMQELLTKGIGRGGHPHTEFKHSAMGRIPKAWGYVKFESVVTKVGSGVTPTGGSAVYTSSGVPFIRSQNVYSDGLRWDDFCFISEEQHKKMGNSQLKPRDVLLNITGASIGRCYYLDDDFIEGNVNQHVCIIRCDPNLAFYVYLSQFISSDHGQRQIMNLQAGGNREGLNFQQIRAMEIPLPPIAEQMQISKMISSVDADIKARNLKLGVMQKTKKALMQDLLTGKVRVEVTQK